MAMKEKNGFADLIGYHHIKEQLSSLASCHFHLFSVFKYFLVDFFFYFNIFIKNSKSKNIVGALKILTDDTVPYLRVETYSS